MSNEIDSKQAIVIFAKHAEGIHHHEVHDYASARESLEKKAAYALQDFKADGLLKKARALSDFELIGVVANLQKIENDFSADMIQGIKATGLTTVVGVGGWAAGGWAAGATMACATFGLGLAKTFYALASSSRNADKMKRIINDIAAERETETHPAPHAPTIA